MAYEKVDPRTSAEIKILYQRHNVRGRDLVRYFPRMSRANIYKHARRPLGTEYSDKRKGNPRRPRTITGKLARLIMRQVQKYMADGESFCSKDLQVMTSTTDMMNNRTLRRELNRNGLKYLHLRKKGVLTEEDHEKRMKFARKCKRILTDDFWKYGISMYLDGVGFEWKLNPMSSAKTNKTMGWRRTNQGLAVREILSIARLS